MRNILLSLALPALLNACNITPQQGLQAVGSMVVLEKYKTQSNRLCTQQTDGALRLECQKQAQKEFQEFQDKAEGKR